MLNNRAGREMVSGIQQFMNFKVMLKQAIGSAGAHHMNSASGADFSGWAIPAVGGYTNIYFVIIRFEEPENLLFLCESSLIRNEHRHEWAVDRLDSKTLVRSIDLGSEEVQFFSRSLDSQITVLEEFVSSCLPQTTYRPDPESVNWDELNDNLNEAMIGHGRGDEDEGRGGLFD